MAGRRRNGWEALEAQIGGNGARRARCYRWRVPAVGIRVRVEIPLRALRLEVQVEEDDEIDDGGERQGEEDPEIVKM